MPQGSNHRVVIVAAGGRGVRAGFARPKQLLCLGGIMVIERVLQGFQASSDIDDIVLVAESSIISLTAELNLWRVRYNKLSAITEGGCSRTESVWNGLRACPPCRTVLVHDAARPLFSQSLVSRAIDMAEKHGAAIPVIESPDTLKTIDLDGVVSGTVSRTETRLVQTPQAFLHAVLFPAYEKAMREGFCGTDDASLVEHYGGHVYTFPGERYNLKITFPLDVKVAEALLTVFEEAGHV